MLLNFLIHDLKLGVDDCEEVHRNIGYLKGLLPISKLELTGKLTPRYPPHTYDNNTNRMRHDHIEHIFQRKLADLIRTGWIDPDKPILLLVFHINLVSVYDQS